MSRWLPETAELHLGDDQPVAAPLAAGSPGAADLLAHVARQLNARALRKWTRLRCVIGGEAVRHAVVPWIDELAAPAQRQRLAEQTFFETYGEQARGWTVCQQGAGYGAASLACAIEKPLLDGLEAAARARGLVLVSVQPALMHAFNHVRRSLTRGLFWFVLVERRSVTLLLMSATAPLQVKRLPLPPAGLGRLLDREWFALGQVGPRCAVFVARSATAVATTADTLPAYTEPWSITALTLPPATRAGEREPVSA